MTSDSSIASHLREMPSEELLRLRDGLNALAGSHTWKKLMELVEIEEARLDRLIDRRATAFKAHDMNSLVKEQAERANIVGRRQGVGLAAQTIELVDHIAERVEAEFEEGTGDVGAG
jgi:hypothetical protein